MSGGERRGGPVFYYDGECGVCSRSVELVLRHDLLRRARAADAVALFSSRSSSEGRGVLTRSRMALLGSLLVGHAGSAVFAWKASWD